METVFEVASIVWIVGAVVLAASMMAAYFITMAQVKDAQHLFDRVYLSNRVLNPAVYGVFSGKIILPKEFAEDERKMILLHEYAHLRRHDNLWRMIAVATACLHWFNPLCWLYLKAFLEDLELSCDEAVLRQCTAQERKSYAMTLLNCAGSKSLYASTFGGAKLRVRVERILSYRRLSVLSMAAFVVFAIILGYVLLKNPG